MNPNGVTIKIDRIPSLYTEIKELASFKCHLILTKQTHEGPNGI